MNSTIDQDRDRHFRRTGSDYTVALVDLLPWGLAWSREPGSVEYTTCSGLAEFWGYVDSRAADLLETESDPRFTLELLSDWERNWGLPEKCLAEPLTIAERHLALLNKMTMLGGQSRKWFIDLAKSIGYDITITEYAPFVAGISRCGDTWGYNPDDTNPHRNRWMLGPPENRYYWTVHVNSLKFVYFRTGGSQCGDRLMTIGLATDLECLLRRYKPMHTEIIFDYSPLASVDYSQAFNSGYIIMGLP